MHAPYSSQMYKFIDMDEPFWLSCTTVNSTSLPILSYQFKITKIYLLQLFMAIKKGLSQWCTLGK